MCTIQINTIQKSHSIEEKEIKNLENQLSKQLTDFYQVYIHKCVLSGDAFNNGNNKITELRTILKRQSKLISL
jgi:hypothetical protein